MTRSGFASLGLIASLVFLTGPAQAQNAVNATGNWSVTASGEVFATGTVRIVQDGSTIVGTYGQGGRIDGKFAPGTLRVDATWTDSRGHGWMTLVFASNGSGFTAEWGRPGSKPSGRFVASRAAYPPVSGSFHMSGMVGPDLTSRVMKLHQLGSTVVGNFGPRTEVDGTMASDANNLTGTWKTPSGEGWIKLQFTDDSRSFAGTWGFASDAQQPQGHIIGAAVSHAQLWVRGLWNVASSGEAFATSTLKLSQEGQTVIGSYKGGHLQGTLPIGSVVLTGRWRDSRGTGNVVLKFAANGKSFQGKWTIDGKTGGSIIGKRNIASSPALRE